MALPKQLIVLLALTYFVSPMSADNFTCGDGTSIPISWYCDNVKDCANESDEMCDHIHQCKVDEYMCRSGECLPAAFKCSGLPDCVDGGDERDCPITKNTNSDINGGSGSFCQSFYLPAFWMLTFVVAQFRVD
ncbi:hypothetical protein M3Y97_00365000 [Aphelenchoides bicaudatus]|nr:hypothetical protein M3Y97_00365000 [Aphelenchoides bicaudatus]